MRGKDHTRRDQLAPIESDFISRYLKNGRGLTFQQKKDVIESRKLKGSESFRAGVAEGLTSGLREKLDEILFVSPNRAGGLIAEAIAFGPRSRMVALSGEVFLAAAVIGTAISVYIDTFPEENSWRRPFPQGKVPMTSEEFLELADSWGKEAAVKPRDVRLSEAKRLFTDLVRDPAKQRREVASRLSVFPFSDTHHLYLADQIMQFTVAHEVAHHLLQHERPEKGRIEAREYLSSTLAGLSYELPSVKGAHRQEFEADALALLLLMNRTGSELSWDHALKIIGGAFGSMVLFDVLEESVGSRLGARVDSHPAVSARACVLFDLVHLMCQHLDRPFYNRLLGRTTTDNPQNLGFQVWACRGFLQSVQTSPLWLPGERRGSRSPLSTPSGPFGGAGAAAGGISRQGIADAIQSRRS